MPPEPPATAAATAAATADVPATPTVLRLEASARGADGHPIEVGFVLPDGTSHCTLIRPAPGWTHWDVAEERRHRITRDVLARHGRDAAAVAGLLNERLGGRTVHADDIASQRAWLERLFEAAGVPAAFRLDDLRTLLSEREAALWAVVTQQVAVELRLPRHRASGDARVLQSAWRRLRGPLGGRGDRAG